MPDKVEIQMLRLGMLRTRSNMAEVAEHVSETAEANHVQVERSLAALDASLRLLTKVDHVAGADEDTNASSVHPTEATTK